VVFFARLIQLAVPSICHIGGTRFLQVPGRAGPLMQRYAGPSCWDCAFGEVGLLPPASRLCEPSPLARFFSYLWPVL
jgi:hypothetical protein